MFSKLQMKKRYFKIKYQNNNNKSIFDFSFFLQCRRSEMIKMFLVFSNFSLPVAILSIFYLSRMEWKNSANNVIKDPDDGKLSWTYQDIRFLLYVSIYRFLSPWKETNSHWTHPKRYALFLKVFSNLKLNTRHRVRSLLFQLTSFFGILLYWEIFSHFKFFTMALKLSFLIFIRKEQLSILKDIIFWILEWMTDCFYNIMTPVLKWKDNSAFFAVHFSLFMWRYRANALVHFNKVRCKLLFTLIADTHPLEILYFVCRAGMGCHA